MKSISIILNSFHCSCYRTRWISRLTVMLLARVLRLSYWKSGAVYFKLFSCHPRRSCGHKNLSFSYKKSNHYPLRLRLRGLKCPWKNIQLIFHTLHIRYWYNVACKKAMFLSLKIIMRIITIVFNISINKSLSRSWYSGYKVYGLILVPLNHSEKLLWWSYNARPKLT